MLGGSCSSCCADPCNVAVTKVTVTFDNLPANCVNRPGNFNGSYMLRDLPLFNGCVIQLFKTTAQNSCVFNGEFPARQNSASGCNIGLSIVYRPLLEEIVIGGIGAINAVVLKPESGQSFRDLPYSGGVVMQSNTFATCTTEQWNGVTVNITTEPSPLAITACPAGTLCTAGVDTLPSPPAGYLYYDDMTCPPCGSERIVLVNVSNPNFSSEYGTIADIPDVTIQVEFDSGSQYYFSGLGTQTLTLKYNAVFPTDFQIPPPLTEQHPTLGPFADPAIDRLGCGWWGDFYFPPSPGSYNPSTYDGPGYVYPPFEVFGDQYEARFVATAIRASITPVGWHMPLDRTTSPLWTLGKNPCDNSDIAYVIKLIAYHDVSPVVNISGSPYYQAFEYWDGSSNPYYAAVPCTARQCHDGVPQFEESITIPYVRAEPLQTTTNSQHTITVRVL